MDLKLSSIKKLEKYLSNSTKKTIIVYILFLAILFTALGFSIAVFVNSKEAGTLFFLIIISLIIAFLIYLIVLSTVLTPLFNTAFIQKDYKKAIKILSFSKKYGIGVHRIKASYLEILMYLYLDDIENANKLVYSMNNYKPQYYLMCGFTSILLLINKNKINEAKNLYNLYVKQYKSSNNLLYIYKIEALEYLFARLENKEIPLNEGSSFFLDLPIYSRLINNEKIEDNFDPLTFVSRADNEGKTVKTNNPLLHKLFYWTMFSPLIGIVVGYLSTVTILSIDPTSEPTAGLLTLFAVGLIPLTTLIITVIVAIKTKNNNRSDKNLISSSVILFLLLLVATSGLKTRYDHDYSKVAALANEANIVLPSKGKSAYLDNEKIKLNKNTILTYGKKATAFFSNSDKKKEMDNIVLSDTSNFIPLKEKNDFFGNNFPLPIDYMSYGINEVDDIENTYFLFFNKTLNTYNESFALDQNIGYEVYIFSYYLKSGWLKITNYTVPTTV